MRRVHHGGQSAFAYSASWTDADSVWRKHASVAQIEIGGPGWVSAHQAVWAGRLRRKELKRLLKFSTFSANGLGLPVAGASHLLIRWDFTDEGHWPDIDDSGPGSAGPFVLATGGVLASVTAATLYGS